MKFLPDSPKMILDGDSDEWIETEPFNPEFLHVMRITRVRDATD
jgi:hypothetical protein